MMRTVLVVALVALPRPAVAAACEESAPLLEGEEAECDGVLVGPGKLAKLLDARDELAVCKAELKASEAVSVIDRRACDQRVGLVEQALSRATDKLVEDACAARILFVVQVVLAHRSSSPHRSDAFKVAAADCMSSTRVRVLLSYTSRCL